MAHDVQHIATIVALHPRSISVEFSAGVKCQGCGVAALCGAASNKLKFNIKVDDASIYALGEQVKIVAVQSSSWNAIFITLLLPALLLCAAVLILLAVGVGQQLAATGGIVALSGYYLILYLFGNSVNRRLNWTVSKLNS